MELVIARNRTPSLGWAMLRVPLEGGVAFPTSGTWPRTTALHCYPVPRSE